MDGSFGSDSQRARVTAVLAGRVQGVGFRVFAQRQAQDLELSGYAENLPDGRVEIVAEGPRNDLEHFLHKLKVGPPHADVVDSEVTWGETGDLKGFYVY